MRDDGAAHRTPSPHQRKRHPERVRVPVGKELSLLGAEDGVLGGLGDAELHDALGRDLDLFAGGRVAADAGLAVHQDELAEARAG